MMLLVILSPLLALGLMLLLQAIETRVLEAGPSTLGARSRKRDGQSAGRTPAKALAK